MTPRNKIYLIFISYIGVSLFIIFVLLFSGITKLPGALFLFFVYLGAAFWLARYYKNVTTEYIEKFHVTSLPTPVLYFVVWPLYFLGSGLGFGLLYFDSIGERGKAILCLKLAFTALLPLIVLALSKMNRSRLQFLADEIEKSTNPLLARIIFWPSVIFIMISGSILFWAGLKTGSPFLLIFGSLPFLVALVFAWKKGKG